MYKLLLSNIVDNQEYRSKFINKYLENDVTMTEVMNIYTLYFGSCRTTICSNSDINCIKAYMLIVVNLHRICNDSGITSYDIPSYNKDISLDDNVVNLAKTLLIYTYEVPK